MYTCACVCLYKDKYKPRISPFFFILKIVRLTMEVNESFWERKKEKQKKDNTDALDQISKVELREGRSMWRKGVKNKLTLTTRTWLRTKGWGAERGRGKIVWAQRPSYINYL